MEIEPRPQAAEDEDTTAEFEAGTPMAHRRTTVTVERETLSFIIRRPPAPEIRNEPSGGKS
jgi:hypothetical protein